MNTHSTDGVRAAVGAMDRELALVGERTTGGEGGGLAELCARWKELVDVLALGPAPEYRACPYCGATGMRAATRCGSCWKDLVPPLRIDVERRGVAR